MIEVNPRECALKCTICGELEGVSPKAMQTPELLKKLVARVAEQHAGCEQFQDNPKRAQAERQYSKRMRAAFSGIALA
jgi:hypothetical protein